MYLEKLGILVVGFESLVKGLESAMPRRWETITLIGLADNCRRGHKRNIVLVLDIQEFMLSLLLRCRWEDKNCGEVGPGTVIYMYVINSSSAL